MSKTLLMIKSAITGDNSQSSALSDHAIEQWQALSATHEVITRHVSEDAIPHLDGQRVGAFFTPEEHRSVEQKAVITFSDQLIDEVKQADAIVIAAPMYNFGIPSQLKAYFDHLARAGVTFKYTDTGPVGLLDDKPVYVIAARGGLYQEAGIDFQVPFIKQFLDFIGLKQVEVVYAEGLAMGEAEPVLANAKQQISDLIQDKEKANEHTNN